MAKVISNSTLKQPVVVSHSFAKVISIGVFLGIANYGITLLLNNFFSLAVSGNVSMILTAVIGVVLMVLVKINQPLIMALSVGFVLWGLSSWSEGLGGVDIVMWNILLFGLSYLLFFWILRYSKLVTSIVMIFWVILIVRVVARL